MALPEGWAEEGLPAPPALLDGCFQVVSGCWEWEGEDEGVWQPLGWAGLWLSGGLPDRLVCRARLQSGGGETRKADLGLYTVDGECLGGVSGFTLKRTSREALAVSRVEDLLYGVEWRSGERVGLSGAAFVRDPGAVAAEVRTAAALGSEASELDAEVGELERESRWFALSALEALGWSREAGERFEGEELRRRLKVTGDHGKLFGRLLVLLADAGVLVGDGEGEWLVAVGSEEPLPPGVVSPPGSGNSVEQELLRRCGGALSEVLRGRADPLELLFGEEPGAADLYWKSRGAGALNRLAGEALGAAVSGLPAGRRLRVLEVGAGTGATTGAVLAALPAERTEYDYTDVSAGFFAAAEERFGESGAEVRYRTLDIERDPEEQGFGAHGYDVVLAANVLHATRDLGESLVHCRKLLAPSGLLLLLEGTARRGWLDLTFGLLPGWWRFADGYRPDYALAAAPVWERALSDAGFGETARLEPFGGQALLLARGPSEVSLSRGLFVLSGGGELGAALGRELGDRGQAAVSGPSGGSREAWGSFFRSLSGDASGEVPLRGVVHLPDVSLPESGGGGAGLERPVAELASELRSFGSGALSLTQGLLDAGVSPGSGVWLVTRGAQVVEGRGRGRSVGSAAVGLRAFGGAGTGAAAGAVGGPGP